MTAAEWGYPLDIAELKLFVKCHLDSCGRVEKRFKNNAPGDDWCHSYLKRSNVLSTRMCQNVKHPDRSTPMSQVETIPFWDKLLQCCAHRQDALAYEVEKRIQGHIVLSRETVNEYFNELEETIKDIPPENVLNYDESNLSDDPGAKKVICKKGVKRVPRIMDSTKSSTSIMMCVSADGNCLPPYVVYKAVNLYDTWCAGGPDGCRYNRSSSGWFEAQSFADWFRTIPLRYLKAKDGQKFIIGDNLSTHLSLPVVKACEKYNIKFVFLPPNSTHVLQPLDVSFFGPMKRIWRKNLETFKTEWGGRSITMPKDQFPKQLGLLMKDIQPNMQVNIKSGFSKTGIYPVSREQVICQFPSHDDSVCNTSNSDVSVSSSMIQFFEKFRFKETENGPAKKKKKLSVPSGRSVCVRDICPSDSETDSISDATDSDTTSGETGSGSSSGDEIDDSQADTVSTDSSEDSGSEVCENWMGVSADRPPRKGQFVLVSYDCGRGRSRFYIGKVAGVKRNIKEINFLRQFKNTSNVFVWPTVDDISEVSDPQIVGVVENPQELRRGLLKFNVDTNQWS